MKAYKIKPGERVDIKRLQKYRKLFEGKISVQNVDALITDLERTRKERDDLMKKINSELKREQYYLDGAVNNYEKTRRSYAVYIYKKLLEAVNG
jgi:hypothetical protein